MQRIKILTIDEQDVFGLFVLNAGLKGKIRLPLLTGVPDGTVLKHIFHSMERRCWCLVLTHPSFPAVPAGTIPDYVEGVFELVTIDSRSEVLGANSKQS
jgi:hypothetical protein